MTTATLTAAQTAALQDICERYGVEFRAGDYQPQFDLPAGYVGGWVGGCDHGLGFDHDQNDWVRSSSTTIYVGVDPEGRISS